MATYYITASLPKDRDRLLFPEPLDRTEFTVSDGHVVLVCCLGLSVVALGCWLLLGTQRPGPSLSYFGAWVSTVDDTRMVVVFGGSMVAVMHLDQDHLRPVSAAAREPMPPPAAELDLELLWLLPSSLDSSSARCGPACSRDDSDLAQETPL
jgi:hypothetical protein